MEKDNDAEVENSIEDMVRVICNCYDEYGNYIVVEEHPDQLDLIVIAGISMTLMQARAVQKSISIVSNHIQETYK